MNNSHRDARRESNIQYLKFTVSRRLVVGVVIILSLLNTTNYVFGEVLLQLNLRQGWNFFSLPVTPQATDIEAFFEGKKAGKLWIFQEDKYQPTDQLKAGIGFWVYLSESISVTYTGDQEDVAPPAYRVGWNNFVTYENLDIPENAMGTVWTFDGTRFRAVPEKLIPGLGYWLNFENVDGITNGSVQTDSDGNEIPDFWEAVWNLKGADGDQDLDSVTNLQEFQSGTNPFNADSDEDNIFDGQELTVDSNPADSSSVPPANSLAFLDQPATVMAPGALPRTRVALIDQFGNIVSTSGAEISIDLQNNPSNGTLVGTRMVTTVDGIAEFADLELAEIGVGYTLAASANGFSPVVSGSFEILQSVSISIAGKVVDENDEPVPGARVRIHSLNIPEVVTNGNGVFNVELGLIPSGEKVSLQVLALGFTTGEETVPVFPSKTASVTIKIKHVQMTKEGTVGELVDGDGNLVIETPGGSACVIVPDPASTLGTTGNICMELTYGDPKVDQDIFPGEFAAEDSGTADGTIGLASIAFGEIRVMNMDTGQQIEDLDGMATMILEIPPGTVNPKTQTPYEIGDTIEIWDFDEAKGIWVRGVDDEGNEIDAIVEFDSATGKLVARFVVPHFSWWNVDVPVETHHCLTGKVVDQEGNPISDAIVTASGVDYNGTTVAITDEFGNYCVDVMRGSTISIGARLDVLLSQQVTVAVPDVQSTCTAPIGTNNACTPIEDLVIGEGTCISGTVKDDSGNVIANTVLEAVGLNLWTTTDDNGVYCMDGLPMNSSITLRSFSVINGQFVSRTDSVDTASQATKCIDNNCLAQDLVLDTDASCARGKITDNEGDNLVGATVWTSNGAVTTTDANGEYCLTTPKNSSETINIAYWDPQTGILNQDSIMIADTGDSGDCAGNSCLEQNRSLDLLNVGCINGAVKNDSGDPLQDVFVYVPGYPWGITDSNGNYCITAPVRNNVTVFCTLTAPNGRFMSSQATVNVAGAGTCPAGGCALLDHTLTVDVGCVTGVVQADGQPVADVSVVNSIGSVTTTDTAGAFCIEVIKGEDDVLNFNKSLGNGQSLSFSRDVSTEDTSETGTCSSGNCFDLGVVAGNRSPVLVELTISQDSVLAGETVTVSASTTDADGDPLTYSWNALGEIEGAGTSVQWTVPNVVTEGDVPISVQISDGQGGITSGSVTIRVTPTTGGNRPPVIVNGPTGNPSTVAPNQAANLIVEATDPDGDTLTYSWTATGGMITGESASVSWVAPADEGTYQIEVTVSDGEGSTSGSVLLTVSAASGETLSVTVTDPDDLAPVAGARVLLHDDNGDIGQEITTGEDGVARFGDIGSPRATITVLRQKSENNQDDFFADWFALTAVDVMAGDLIIPIENGEEDGPDETTIIFDIVVQDVPAETTSVFFSGVISSGSAPEKDESGSIWTFRNQSIESDSDLITTDGTISITAAAFMADLAGFQILKAGTAKDIVLSSLNGGTVIVTLDRDPQDIPFTANKPAQNISLFASGSITPTFAGFTFGQNPQTSGALSAINLDLSTDDFYIQSASSEDDENDCSFTEIRKLGNTLPTELTITFSDFAITTITPTFEEGVLTRVAWTVEGSTESADQADIEIDGVTTVDDQEIEWEIFLSPSTTSLTIPKLPTDIGQPKEPAQFSSISSIDISISDHSSVNGFDDFIAQVQAAFKTGRPGILSLFGALFELGDFVRSAEKELTNEQDNFPFSIPTP